MLPLIQTKVADPGNFKLPNTGSAESQSRRGSLPLDGAGRLGRDVVGDTIHTVNFIDDAR